MGVLPVQSCLCRHRQISAQSRKRGGLADGSRQAALLHRPAPRVQHHRGPCGARGAGTADLCFCRAYHGSRILMSLSANVKEFPWTPAAGRKAQPTLVTRLEQLRKTLRPTPHVPLAVEGMSLFAKLEYVNPVGSIKDRPAYWILKQAAERGEICDETTVIESSSGNFAVALAVFTRLLGLRFIPVIDPNISHSYESFLRRLCPTVVKVEARDDTGGFLKTRLQAVKHLCATIPNAYWTNQYTNPDAMEAHYELTASEICTDFDSLDYVFISVSTAGTIAGMSPRLKERYPKVRVIGVDTKGSVVFRGEPPKRDIP